MKNKYPRFNFLKLAHQVPSFVWLFLFSSSLILFTVMSYQSGIMNIVAEVEEVKLRDPNKGYLIKTKGCKILDLPITTKDMEKYFEYEFSGAHCNDDLPPLVESNLTSIFLLKDSFKSYNISNTSLLDCCYEELKRKIPHGESDQQYEYGKICYVLQDGMQIEEEFIHVKCNYNGKKIYEDFFAFIPRKTDIPNNLNGKKMNVLIIGIDGISRINFHRQMPNTTKRLKQLEFEEFFGYNKVADNTYPNLISVLTGNDEDTIQKTCRKTGKYYDNCTFIWKNFKNNNYITSFAEDSAWMGIFNYQKYGFQRQPTDYMWGFFDRIAEDLLGNSKSMNVIQCIGSREGYKMIVQYIYDFVYSMNSWKLPYFAFFWSSSLSHDFLNKPRIGDDLYSNLFQKMYEEGLFKNTVVIAMSDHGIRFGSFRGTYQGRLEERLPFLFIRLPEEFRSKYHVASSNLKVNLRRLTTPFDLHETLYDLTVPENLSDDFITNGKRNSKSRTGLSLFHQIKPSRTCETAGIADHWCTCLDSKPIDIDDVVKNTTNFAVNYLNNLLKGYAQCATLSLKKILNAQILSHAEKALKSKVGMKDFMIGFVTEPGDGSFEATVRKTDDGNMHIVGTVSRLNLYGQQSACITDFHLKLYCYCKGSFWS